VEGVAVPAGFPAFTQDLWGNGYNPRQARDFWDRLDRFRREQYVEVERAIGRAYLINSEVKWPSFWGRPQPEKAPVEDRSEAEEEEDRPEVNIDSEFGADPVHWIEEDDSDRGPRESAEEVVTRRRRARRLQDFEGYERPDE
jgi:hypothetical protein